MSGEPNIFRVVHFSRGGQTVVDADFEKSDHVWVPDEGELKITVTPPTLIEAKSSNRYEGSWAVEGDKPNYSITGMLAIKGDDVEDAKERLEDFLQLCEQPGRGQWVQFGPAGSRAGYYERRGPAQYDPTLKYTWLDQGNVLTTTFAFPVAPGAMGPPMDIADDFAINSLAEDWTADEGAFTWAGGKLTITDTSTRRLRHTGRGYTYGDVQVTAKIRTGASVAGIIAGVFAKAQGSGDHVEAVIVTGNTLRLQSRLSGVYADLTTVAETWSTNTDYWIRLRIEGNVVTAEVFTSAPTPMATPLETVSHTLTGGNLTAFGSAVEGECGIVLRGVTGTDLTIDDFTVEPYTYRNHTFPEKISMYGAIPGRRRARASVFITPSGGTDTPVFFALGWCPRPSSTIGGSEPPFGRFLPAAATGLTGGWSVQSGAPFNTAQGGSMLAEAAVGGAESYVADYLVDPTAIPDPDEFEEDILAIEVWCTIMVESTIVAPKVIVSTVPQEGTTWGPQRFSDMGQSGPSIPLPSTAANQLRHLRAGRLIIPKEDRGRRLYVRMNLQCATGSAGQFGLGPVLMYLARARAVGIWGEANDASYPPLARSNAEVIREFTYDGRGYITKPGGDPDRDNGIGGNAILLPAGNVDLLGKIGSQVPLDPTVNAVTEQATQAATLHMAVQPSWNVVVPDE